MKDTFDTWLVGVKGKALNTEVKPWKKKTSALFYLTMCILSVAAILISHQYETAEKKDILFNLFSVSVIWLISELLLIWFFYSSSVIPMYARFSFGFVIAFSNLWFLFFALNKLSI